MKRFLILLLGLIFALSATGCRPSSPAAPSEETEPVQTTASSDPATEPPTEAPTEPAPTEPEQLYIEFSREGQVDRVPVTVVHGTVGNYTIAYDPERFTPDGDTFHDHVWGDLQPHVYYAVSFFPDMTAQELADGLALQYAGDFATSETDTAQIGQYDAIGLYFSKDDTLMTQQHFFAIDAPSGGAYLLETQFILEMYEGLYPQIRAAMDTFTILE